MRLNVMLEPQLGLTYAEILGVARRAEELGFEGLYRSDHYTHTDGSEGRGSTDAWTSLAGLARETSRLRLGSLVSPATFRAVGNLAKCAATVCEMAGVAPDGRMRVDLGMGTGWLEAEHRRYGLPFEDLATRFARLEEHLEVVHRWWRDDDEPFDFAGRFVTVAGTRFLPEEHRPRLIVGGTGMRRTPMLAARFADELNGAHTPEDAGRQRAALQAACREIGRDPAAVTYSVMTGCLVAGSDAELRERMGQLVAALGADLDVDAALERFSTRWIVGTPDAARATVAAYADAGVERLMLQYFLAEDLTALDAIADALL